MTPREIVILAKCGYVPSPLTKENVYLSYEKCLIKYDTMQKIIKTGQEVGLWS